MTSTPPPQPQPGRPVVPVIRPLRDLAAYALVAAPAVWLFVAIVRLVPSGVGQDFLTRVQNSFYSFVNIELIAMPLAAVLLATLVEPRHKHARLITLAALVEYAVAGFFAVVFGFLVAVVKLAGFSVRVAFEEMLVRAAWLAVFALAAYAVLAIWRSLYAAPKPQPGMYGQPPQQPWGQQPQWGQPGFPPPGPGQPAPGYAQPGAGYAQPGPGFPQPGSGFAQPGAGYAQPGPAQPGQPQGWVQPPAWGAPPAQPPASAPPASAPPASAPPASAPPAAPPGPFAPAPGNPHATPSYPPGPATPGHGAFSEPTQAFPGGRADEDATRVVGEESPRQPGS